MKEAQHNTAKGKLHFNDSHLDVGAIGQNGCACLGRQIEQMQAVAAIAEEKLATSFVELQPDCQPKT